MKRSRLTEGAIAFDAWLRTFKTQEAAAAALGLSQQDVSKIANGRRVPRTFAAITRLRDVCGIPPEAWTRKTRRLAPPFRERSAPAAESEAA